MPAGGHIEEPYKHNELASLIDYLGSILEPFLAVTVTTGKHPKTHGEATTRSNLLMRSTVSSEFLQNQSFTHRMVRHKMTS